jgi:hypothetical protein
MALRATKCDKTLGGRPILAAAAFLGGQNRMKAGCGQDCHKPQTDPLPYSVVPVQEKRSAFY